jgi:sigma-B regulation protein RsbU (phosphoserine phosphatase)
VNERILSDTRGGMFVTAFYGVLEPDTGRLRYVNAGHNPPILVSSQRGKPIDQLHKTGMALGVVEGTTWQQKIARLSSGDILLLYTDGVTEAQNAQGQFFGEQRLMEVVRSKLGRPALEIQEAVLAELYRFMGDAPKQDDITLVVLVRK